MATKKSRQDQSETQAARERRKDAPTAQELDTRFRDALTTGEIAGDVVMVDEQGNEVKRPQPHKTIFDL
ncbi:MAG: hypothetical protein JO250_05310 [Armatimonadetes bacterium]|nr:hypothetical protein [Armatimonadota bacterium]